jgi:DNA helicase-2/ATP-dependent DNA helicase PcrA
MQIALNPEQRDAVWHGEGPLLILAGAGSGKTRVLTARIARLLDEGEAAPWEILAVTFTNKAAGVMRERIAGMVGEEPRGLWMGTFHSIAARLLRREGSHLEIDPGFTIYDEDDSIRAIRTAMEEAGIDPQRWSAGAVRARISQAKNGLVRAAEYEAEAFDLAARTTAKVYPEYERILRRSNALDFDDLLLNAVRLLEEHEEVGQEYAYRFRHVLVDEYQDTNHAQYRMVRSLAAAHGNICVVGDDDQSIYGWRGADLRNILDFERDFPGARVLRLEENYRSTRAILEVANCVIANNRARKEKRLRTAREAGDPVAIVRVPDERAEASWTVREIEALSGRYGHEECAVLYRTNAQSRPYEDALRRAGIPYRIVGGVRFYERREIKDVLAYLQLAVNPFDEASFQRAIGWPRRGVGSVTLGKLRAAARAADRSLLDMAGQAEALKALPAAGRRALTKFAADIAALAEMQIDAPVEEVIQECLQRFQIVEALDREEDGADRIANVMELLAAAASFDPNEVEDDSGVASPLALYLQSVSLIADIDQWDSEAGSVTLMSLHNAKGLEFPVVFVGGLEEGLLPLSRAAESAEGLEEERRLLYVGITRSQDRLYLSHADRRWRAGSESRSRPSSFLDEVPVGAEVDRRMVGGHTASRRARFAARQGWRGAAAGKDRSGEAPEPQHWWRRSAHGPRTGRHYDYSESQVPLELEEGARVVHPRFGPGTITTLSGAGRATKAEIEFDNGESKKVMVAHAGLRPA